MTRPPPDAKAVRILLRIAWKRFYNRTLKSMAIPLFKRKKKKRKGRGPSAPKQGAGIAGSILFIVFMFLGFGTFSMNAVGTFLLSAMRPEQIDAGSGDDGKLTWSFFASSHLGSALERINNNREPDAPSLSLRDIQCDIVVNVGLENERGFHNYYDYVKYVFLQDALNPKQDDPQHYAEVRTRHYEQYGPDGFVFRMPHETSIYSRRYDSIFSSEARPAFRSDPLLPKGAALLSLFLMLTVLFIGGELGRIKKVSANTALDDLEWTMAYPVKGRVILFTQLLRNTLIDVLGWCILLPACFFLFIAAGYGVWSVPCCLLATGGIKLMCGGAILFLQVVVPRRLSSRRTAMVFGLMQAAGMLSYFSFLFLSQSPMRLEWIRHAASYIPSLLLYLPPFSMGIALCGGASAIIGIGSVVIGGGALGWAGVVVAGRLLQTRGKAASNDNRRRTAQRSFKNRLPYLTGQIRKELLVLFRNRTALLQVILIPFVILGFQGFTLFHRFSTGQVETIDFKHVAALAYGVGAYASIFSSSTSVHAETNLLWLLFSMPWRTGRLLMRKVLIQGSVCLAHPLLVLGCALFFLPLELAMLPLAVLAIGCAAGVSFASGALFFLGSDMQTSDPKKRIKQKYIWLQLAMLGLPVLAFYQAGLWGQVRMLVAVWLIGLAFWQKVNHLSPWLLDPVEKAPPRMSMADGLLAACVFFLVQTVAGVILLGNNAPVALSLLFGFIAGGIAAVLFSWVSLILRKIPGAYRFLGWKPLRNARSRLSAISIGFLYGAAAAALGFLWIYLCAKVPLLSAWKEAALEGKTLLDQTHWITLVLAVGAAPLFEEPIFRGMLLNGVLKDRSPLFSVLASSLIFMLIHPAISALPVFLMGVFAALAYLKSGRLLSAVLVHMIYNAVVVLGTQTV